jgi:hypothetical protein
MNPPPTASSHLNKVIIHGLILAWGGGQRLSNPNILTTEPMIGSKHRWTRIKSEDRIAVTGFTPINLDLARLIGVWGKALKRITRIFTNWTTWIGHDLAGFTTIRGIPRQVRCHRDISRHLRYHRDILIERGSRTVTLISHRIIETRFFLGG